MNYHNITTDDMRNGDGLRTVLWVAGCNHHCKGCQNPVTWNPYDGLIFDVEAEQELYSKVNKSYISGVTFSGGDPLYPENRDTIFHLAKYITKYMPGMKWIDILVDGEFVEKLSDVNYPWAGSTNQRVIAVQESLRTGTVVLKGE